MLRKIGIPVAALGIIIGLAYVGLFSSFFHISKVALEKNGNAVSATQLSPFLDKLKGKNILFVQTGNLEREIEKAFPNQILLAKIKKSYPGRLTVKVEEHPAVFNFRIVSPEAVKQFVVNQIGYSILENVEDKNVPLLIWKSKTPVAEKATLIPKEKLLPMITAFQKFQEIFGIKIVEGEWKKTERELHLKTEKGFFVWLDLTQDVEHQLMKLKRSLPKLDIYREPIAYIDLRISGGENEKVILMRRR